MSPTSPFPHTACRLGGHFFGTDRLDGLEERKTDLIQNIVGVQAQALPPGCGIGPHDPGIEQDQKKGPEPTSRGSVLVFLHQDTKDGIPRLVGRGVAVKKGDEIQGSRKGEKNLVPSPQFQVKSPE